MSGQAKSRRLARAEDRQFEGVVLAGETDGFGPVNAVVVARLMTVPAAVSVPVAAASQREQRGDGDPTAESDERDAGKYRHEVSEFCGKRDARYPHDESQEQRRDRMPCSGESGRTSDFPFGPPLLSRDESYRQPVVGHERVKNAYRQHRDDQKPLLFHDQGLT